jgi:hypothetical protein
MVGDPVTIPSSISPAIIMSYFFYFCFPSDGEKRRKIMDDTSAILNGRFSPPSIEDGQNVLEIKKSYTPSKYIDDQKVMICY